MSAKERRHEDAPKKIDERDISKECLSSMQTPEIRESVASAQERIRDEDRCPESSAVFAPERDDTCDRLLCAISDTEIAKRMMQAGAHAATPFPTAGAEILLSAGAVHSAPAGGTTRTFIVHSSPAGASMALMPLAAIEPRHSEIPEPESSVEDEKTLDRLLRAIGEAGHPGGEIPASNPQCRFLVQTSPAAASVPLMPAAAATPHRRVSATPRSIEATRWDAVRGTPMPPQTVAEAAPEVITPRRRVLPARGRSPRTAFLVWYSGEIERGNARFARTAKSMCRGLWRIPARIKNRVMAKTALALESTGRAATQLSLQFKNSTKTMAAPVMGRLGRSTWQISVRLWNLAETKTALTMESAGRAATQLSLQFKNSVKTKAAPAMGRLGRSTWQVPVRLWNLAEALTAPTMERAETAELQLSTGSGDCVDMTQSAPDMDNRSESMSPVGSELATRLQRWFGPRRSSRMAMPPVVAYCWTADTPDPIKIADISSGGVYLLTDARWPRGGVLSMTLQRTDRTSDTPESWVVIDFVVVRLCGDGVAGAFIPSTHRLSPFIPSRAENCADDKTLKRFVRHLAEPARA